LYPCPAGRNFRFLGYKTCEVNGILLLWKTGKSDLTLEYIFADIILEDSGKLQVTLKTINMTTPGKLRVIITGSTGMVGEGVLHECLQSNDVESVLIVNRKHLDISHPKLTEVLHEDFLNLSPVEDKLSGYSACFFCLGVSSVGMARDKYYETTYKLTLHFAETIVKQNPDMTFCYVSGAGTDSTEKGRSAWARVKGKTENDLKKLPFRDVYLFRPGYIQPTPGLKNANKMYSYFKWMYPVGRNLWPKYFSTLSEVGQAMINAAKFGFPKKVLAGKEISELSRQSSPNQPV
jgi:hypothetical protein